MELDALTVDLIKQLEYIVGKNVFNKYTKTYDDEERGDMIRYPCLMRNLDNGVLYRYSGTLYDATPDSIPSAYYNFGANNLNIGDALIEILECIEDRYNIDFNDLEDKRITEGGYDPREEPEFNEDDLAYNDRYEEDDDEDE